MIGVLCDSLPHECIEILNSSNIMNDLFILIEINDLNLRRNIISLFGDIAKTNNLILNEKIDHVITFIIQFLENPNSKSEDASEKLQICINSCWTLGSLSITHKINFKAYIDKIMSKLLKILCVPRVKFNNLA